MITIMHRVCLITTQCINSRKTCVLPACNLCVHVFSHTHNSRRVVAMAEPNPTTALFVIDLLPSSVYPPISASSSASSSVSVYVEKPQAKNLAVCFCLWVVDIMLPCCRRFITLPSKHSCQCYRISGRLPVSNSCSLRCVHAVCARNTDMHFRYQRDFYVNAFLLSNTYILCAPFFTRSIVCC